MEINCLGKTLPFHILLIQASQVVQVKNPPANVRGAIDVGLIPGSGRSPGVGNGNPLQYSYLENSMDRVAWWAIVHRVKKSLPWLSYSAESRPPLIHDIVSNSVYGQTTWDGCSPALCTLTSLLPLHPTHMTNVPTSLSQVPAGDLPIKGVGEGWVSQLVSW